MIKYIILLTLLTLAGCATIESKPEVNTTVTNLRPITTPIINDEAHIKWIRFEDPIVLQQACYKLGLPIKPFQTILACSYTDLDTKECTIYTMTPKAVDDDHTTSLGHEALHCFTGQYHKR